MSGPISKQEVRDRLLNGWDGGRLFHCDACEKSGTPNTGPHSHVCQICGGRAQWGWYTTPRCAEHRLVQQGGTRVKVPARTRMYRADVIPADARPGDLVVGNGGAGAIVREYGSSLPLTGALNLEYAGNFGVGTKIVSRTSGRVYDYR